MPVFSIGKKHQPALVIGEKESLKVLKQTGQIKDILRDAGRKAKAPGKRISKTGKIYYEYRRNRSDLTVEGI